MKLREKLFLAAFSIGILILFAGIIASNFGEKLEGEFKESERIRLQVIGSATEISSYVKRAEGHLLLYLLMGDISDGDKFPNRMVLLGDHLEALKPVINEPAERKLIGDMEGKVVKIFSIGNALIELKKNGEFAQRENEAQIKTFHSLTSEVRRNSIKLAQEYIQLQLQKESVLISEMAYAKRKSVILLILSASTALVFGFWWYKNITDNILILKNATGLYAKGEKPNIEINSKDEFGELADAFKKMIFELNLKETLLKEEKVKAEEANAAKSEFLSRMSHELRTPMNAILGFTQLLRIDPENKFSDIQKSNLGQISSAGYHLLALINEVLDLSRVESGYAEISFEPVDMVPFVEDVISILKPLADEKGVSIGYQGIPEMSYIVEVDPLRFKQVVLNIVSNAIKYNKPNGTISVSYEMKEDAKVRLGVKDTGYGIPVNQKEKIFNPFERLGVKPEDIEGTGVGLSISKHLVEMMNGTMGFESEFGIGSFFYIDLPISNKAALPNQI